MRKISLAFLSLLAACGTSVTADPGLGNGGDTNDGNGADAGTLNPAEAEACTKMDIVFVVDDSGSMSEEQNNLAANFPLFLDVIENYRNVDGAPLDYRIAVTTTGRDVDYTMKLPAPFSTEIPISESGDNGSFRQECGMTRRWIERGDTNVKDTFSCLAQVGTSGPSIEMPLYALELGFSERLSDGTNSNFLREDALLAVVILTDEDDCSRTDNNFVVEGDGCAIDDPTYVSVDHSLAFLDNLTGDRGRWATAVIAGPNDCESSFGSAFAANRLQQFVDKTGANGVFSSICDGDLASGLADALDNFDAACNAFPPVD